MIIVLAGRRTDPLDAPVPRFPLAEGARVQQQLVDFFRREHATALVCSGACGADLLALNAAGQAHMSRYMLLPFAKERFRELSVVDRPGEWGPTFDILHKEIRGEGPDHVKVFPTTNDLVRDLVRLNVKILAKGLELAKNGAAPTAKKDGIMAVIVWEGQPRGADDFTATFAQQARDAGIPIKEIPTLP